MHKLCIRLDTYAGKYRCIRRFICIFMRAFPSMFSEVLCKTEVYLCHNSSMNAGFGDNNCERCLVIAAHAEGLNMLREQAKEWAYDFILCADAGQKIAQQLALRPNAFIGDFDSSPQPAGEYIELSPSAAILSSDLAEQLSLCVHTSMLASEVSDDEEPQENIQPLVFLLPPEKDMTDLEAAIDIAAQLGFAHIDVLGGFGGRLDHTLGNVALLAKYVDSPIRLRVFDGINSVTMVGPGTHTVARKGHTYFGVLPYGGCARSVSLSGVKYSVQDIELSDSSTLGVSNEITHAYATVSCEEGYLLLVHSRDT